jgi:NitT/TauT family transport system permease protein
VLVGIVLIATWELAVRAAGIPEYLFPKPSDIAKVLMEDGGTLLRALWSTLRVTFQAFIIATVLGTLIAFVFVQSRLIEVSFFPYAVLLQVTPIVAIAPLIIILVRDTQVALTVCATIIASFFHMHRASRMKTLLRLRIPSALPYFFGGLRISSGLALIGAVVAEFVAGTGGKSAGLAYEILLSGFQLAIPRMFAALFLITLTGVLLFVLMTAISNRVLGSWHESAMKREV